MVKLSHLECLIAVADHGGVSAAGAAIHVAQPAVSRTIQALEAELGVILFDRAGRRFRLTSVGEEVVEQARCVLAEVATLRSLAERAQAEPHHRLVIATTPTLEEVATVRLLQQARPLLRDVHVSIRSVPDPEAVFELVRRGAADLGLSDHPPPTELAAMHLFDEEIVLACPPGHPGADVRVADLAGEPLVLPQKGTERRREFDAFFAQVGLVPDVAVETDDRGSWTAHVLGGLGCAFRYRSQVERLASQGMIGRRLIPPITRRIVLVYPRRSLTVPARAVVELCRDAPPTG